MKSVTLQSLPAFALGLILLLGAAGCNGLFGDDSPSGDAETSEYADSFYSDMNLSLDEENGGYRADDEAPGFGDPSFAQMFGEAATAGDPLESDAGILALEEEPESRVTYVRLIWGQLQRQSDQDQITDWGGSIRVDRGAIVVLRRIRFEPLSDWVVFPREDPKLVELYSQTGPAFDGLLLKIIDPEPESAEANEFALELGAATFGMPVAELAGFSEILDVDELGNQLSVQSPEILDCPNGFLRGVWVGRQPGQLRGIFRGAVTEFGGGLRGHVRGHWGVNASGEQVFRGKMIARDGRFLAFVHGDWSGGGDGGVGRGSFAGVLMDENETVTGALGGHYRHGLRRGGFLAGRWVEDCLP